jgi:hypothetical protein
VPEHTELRLHSIDAADVAAHAGGRAAHRPGSYVWRRFVAFDPESRSGVEVSFHDGYVFSPQYRRTVNRYYAGIAPPGPQLRASAHPAVSISVFEEGKSWRPSVLHYRPSDLSLSENPWRLEIGPNALETESGLWKLAVRGCPWSMTVAGPQLHPDETIRAELSFEPLLPAASVERAYLPDVRQVEAPSEPDLDEEEDEEDETTVIDELTEADEGLEEEPEPTPAKGDPTPRPRPADRHDWLIACPSARVNGTITLRSEAGERRIELDRAVGYCDCIRGDGLLSPRFFRRYATYLQWADGALICDLPMHSKYVQVAATFMLFGRDGALRLFRGDRVRMTDSQFSTRALPYPGEMRWRETGGGLTLRQKMLFPYQSTFSAVRSLVACEASFRAPADKGASDTSGMRTVTAIGFTEVDQPSRLDYPMINRLLDRCLFTAPSAAGPAPAAVVEV